MQADQFSPRNYAYRINGSREHFHLHFRTPAVALRYLATPGGRSALRLGLGSHLLMITEKGGYSTEYFRELQRWRTIAGERRDTRLE